MNVANLKKGMEFKIPLKEVFLALFPSNKFKFYQIWRVVLMQTYFTFIQGIPLLSFISLCVGAAISFQASLGLSIIGAGERLGEIWVFVIFREATPLFTAIFMTARSVTAVASEVATMKQHKEIEALELMGISTIEYVFSPRIAAGMISAFCLATTFAFFSLLGTWLSTNLDNPLNLIEFLSKVSKTFTFADLIFFLLKTTVAGLGIFWIGCLSGLSLKKASFEVPIVTINAVVSSLAFAIFSQLTLSLIFYLIFGLQL